MITIEKSKSQVISRDNFYTISIKLGGWDLQSDFREQHIISLRDRINELLGFQEIADTFHCSIEDAEKISKYHNDRRNSCDECQLKMKACHECVIICQSPLEQDMLISLKLNELEPQLQLRINKDGKSYPYTEPVDKDNILTLPDFYLETENTKLCIYADGHTYHERTEYQAKRDRSIDRELQSLGYKVLRFTGKEIRTELDKVIEDIKKHLKEPIINIES
jgi:hypothetical protein